MFRVRPLQRLQTTTSNLTRSPLALNTPSTRKASTKSTTTTSTPNGLKATRGIELLTAGTPNGHKVSILLEELKAAYDLPYTFQSIDIMENIQKQPWFTAINPNGRIPAIVDHDRGGFAVFEGSAILSYLTRHYDTKRLFSWHIEDDFYSEAEQWIAFQHGGIGPMQGQANHFYRLSKERIPYPTQRYLGESERLYGVLDRRLSNRDYLVGASRGRYSIADMANYSWVNVSYFGGVDLSKFPHLQRWWRTITDRVGVGKGLDIPSRSKLVNAAYLERMESSSEGEFRDNEAELRRIGHAAKESYGHVYKSP